MTAISLWYAMVLAVTTRERSPARWSVQQSVNIGSRHHLERVFLESVLREAFIEASKSLDTKADSLNHVEIGTTMVLAAIVENKLTIAHAGDSRTYFLRPNDGLVYQTKDHLAHSVWGDSIDRSFFSYQQDKANVEVR